MYISVVRGGRISLKFQEDNRRFRWSGWVRKAGGRVGGRCSGRQGQDGSRKSVDWRGGKVRGREGGME